MWPGTKVQYSVQIRGKLFAPRRRAAAQLLEEVEQKRQVRRRLLARIIVRDEYCQALAVRRHILVGKVADIPHAGLRPHLRLPRYERIALAV